MSKGTNIFIGKKYNFKNEETNYYTSAKLDYYKPNAFN